MKRVDVIVPCYNYAHFLTDCVESVLQQTGVETRVLIIDDSSPDDTPEVASDLMRTDWRVEYRRHTSNRGHIATYNEGLDWASGDYTLLLSADDALTPGALQRAVAVMEVSPNVGFVYGPAIRLTAGMPPQTPPTTQYETCVVPGADFIASACATGLNPVPAAAAVVRACLQKKLAGYRPELTHSGDLEMWLRFAAHSAVGYVSAYQAYYRQHSQNMHIEYEQSIKYLQQRRAAFDVTFDTYSADIPNSSALRDLIRRGIAAEAFWHAALAFDRGDDSLCREALAFAVETHPSVRSSRSWRRLSLKQFLGPSLWRALEPSVARIRGQRFGIDGARAEG